MEASKSGDDERITLKCTAWIVAVCLYWGQHISAVIADYILSPHRDVGGVFH